MNTYPSDPLTPEERELAQLIARVGPHGEPSPALDAKILAAAHDAASRRPARKPKPRWPVAIGLAASVVFAVGIAWQLRPVQQIATVAEAPVAYAEREEPQRVAAADAMVAAEQAADAAAEAPPADDSDSFAAATSSVAGNAVSAPPVSATEPAPRAQQPRRAARGAAAPPPEAPPVMQETQASDSHRYSRGLIAPAAPPPPAPAPSMPAPAREESSLSFVDDPEPGAAAQKRQAAELQEYDARAATVTAKQTAGSYEMKANAAAREREMESRSLDRVEVTGSRISRTDLQVPVSNDAQLAVEEWLERVRTRYGLGDAGAAKQSLLLFVKDHPGEPIPDDLEPLLEE